MNISLILAHPDQTSFNHAIAAAARKKLEALGHAVCCHDLYAEGFDGVLPSVEIPRDACMPAWIGNHCAEIAAADGIVIVHPNWWGQPPAILKGWIDRVMRPGVAYEFEEGDGGEGVPRGLLRARAAVILNTANTPQQREDEVFGDPLERIWRDCIFNLCGVTRFYRRIFRVVVASSQEQRQVWLDEVQEIVSNAFFEA